jgi:hypothetical protein
MTVEGAILSNGAITVFAALRKEIRVHNPVHQGLDHAREFRPYRPFATAGEAARGQAAALSVGGEENQANKE